MKKEKLTFFTDEQVWDKHLKDPEFKKAYDALEFEYAIIDALIKTRIEKKLSQRELAKNIGIAQSALARFETGNTNPTLSLLKKITIGLGLKIVVKPA